MWGSFVLVYQYCQGCSKQFESGTAILCNGKYSLVEVFHKINVVQPAWPYLPYRLLRACTWSEVLNILKLLDPTKGFIQDFSKRGGETI